jgi:hypothetical protein
MRLAAGKRRVKQALPDNRAESQAPHAQKPERQCGGKSDDRFFQARFLGEDCKYSAFMCGARMSWPSLPANPARAKG